MPPRLPESLRFGSLTFRVLTLGDGRLAFSYYDGSRRIVVKRRTIGELRAEAQRISTGILNAETAALDMTADDRRIYIAARDTLAPFRMDLDRGARLLAEAATLAGGIDRVIEACRSFSKSESKVMPATTGDVATHFLRHLSSDGVSSLYYDQMDGDLGKFTARFPGPIAAVRSAEIEDWLREAPVGLRRRRNVRDKLVALFNFARDNDYLPANIRTEAEKTKRPKVPRKAPPIYTPEELDLLLVQCAQRPDEQIGRGDYTDFIPVLAIAAFAGLRWAEIQRLQWSHIHWTDGVIEVGEENKTGFRLVPIQPNLASWLAPYRSSHGSICKHARPDHVVRRIGSRAGLAVGGRRYSNGFRHSYVTYRVAVTKNMPLVAVESGHSVSELRKSYNRASLEDAGKRWFGISRDLGNVLQMPLLSLKR